MSDYVLPTLPLIDVEVEEEPFYKTLVLEEEGGTEQRTSLQASARHVYRLRGTLRDYVAAPSPWNPYSEAGIVRWFHDQHKGSGDSFYFDEPMMAKNLLAYSQDLTQAAWVKNSEPGTSVTADAAAAPDGTTTADRIDYVGGGTAGGARVWQPFEQPSVNGRAYVGAWWLKANTGATSLRLHLNLGSDQPIALTTSWQRFTMTGTGNGSSDASLYLMSAVGDNSIFSVYAWGAQAEPASSAGLYVPTGATPVTGRVRVRFEDDRLSIRKIADKIFEVDIALVTLL